MEDDSSGPTVGEGMAVHREVGADIVVDTGVEIVVVVDMIVGFDVESVEHAVGAAQIVFAAAVVVVVDNVGIDFDFGFGIAWEDIPGREVGGSVVGAAGGRADIGCADEEAVLDPVPGIDWKTSVSVGLHVEGRPSAV